MPFGSVYGNPYSDMAMHHNNADLAMNMITLHDLTRDEDYLTHDLYPYLREVAINWDYLLKLNDGRYVIDSES